jgi:hypothetical protein
MSGGGRRIGTSARSESTKDRDWCTIARMRPAPVAATEAAQRMAAEMFLMAAGPTLVKSVAEILGTQGIPVMPLKGVLLQRLVYGDRSYRPISDVDLLVPEPRFLDAFATLRAEGFSETRWEVGRWQVTMTNPKGPPLGIDLHRRLTRTIRSHLTAASLFERGARDDQLFGASVVIPRSDDLFAHLLLHATLHWLNLGKLHRARDFQAVAETLSLEPDACAKHLTRQGLLTHALLMLPMIAAQTRDGGEAVAARPGGVASGSFITDLHARIERTARGRASARLVSAITARFAPGHPARRLAGLALAPSVSSAVVSAARDRLGLREPEPKRVQRP